MAATAAMVIVLSVLNGFSAQLKIIHQEFEPEIIIQPINGKTFAITNSLITKIEKTEGVQYLTEVIEDDVYIHSESYEKLARFKGVTPNYFLQNNIKESILSGTHKFNENRANQAVLGYGLVYALDISLNNEFKPIELIYPKRKKVIRNHNSLNNLKTVPIGVFQIERQYDDQYIFIPIKAAEQLTNHEGRRTSIEVKTTDKHSIEDVVANLEKKLGEKFQIVTGEETHQSLYRAIKIEKLIAFIVLAIILSIASINLYIIVTMMVVSKKKDISIMFAMGATRYLVRKVFFIESIFISVIGAGIGLLVGWFICYVQAITGWIKMGVTSSLIESFPVEMQFADFATVGGVTLLISVLAFIGPILKIDPSTFNQKL